MPTDPLATLSQWFSPAYPIGAFAYSHGLEAAIEAGQVRDGPSLRDWIETVLDCGAGRSDGLFIAATYHADDPARVDGECRAFAPSRGRLMETDLQGAAFCDVTRDIWGIDLRGLTYPVAVGRAAALCDLPLVLTTQMYLQSFVSSLVSVGMRLIPLGQTDGHRMIQSFVPLCQTIAQDTRSGDLEALSSTAFVCDIASMTHETQYAKVFRT